MNKLFENIIGCWKHIPYTIAHRRAFKEVSNNILGYNINPWHDVDKLVLYSLMPFVGKKFVNKFHRKHALHHLSWDKYINGKNLNYVEAIIDWECARYTKSDKPLDAEDTMIKYFSDFAYILYPILKKYNLLKYEYEIESSRDYAKYPAKIVKININKYKIINTQLYYYIIEIQY